MADYSLLYSGEEVDRRLGLVDVQQSVSSLLAGKQSALANPVTGAASALTVWTGTQAQYDAIVADQWALKEVQDMRFFDDDRLHYNSLGHHEVARMVLRALNVPNDLQPMQPDPLPATSWRAARAGDLVWARAHFVPGVLRRLRHQSSGDNITAKRPAPSPVMPFNAERS